MNLDVGVAGGRLERMGQAVIRLAQFLCDNFGARLAEQQGRQSGPLQQTHVFVFVGSVFLFLVFCFLSGLLA